MQGVLKGARSVLERQEAEPPLSFLLLRGVNYYTEKCYTIRDVEKIRK